MLPLGPIGAGVKTPGRFIGHLLSRLAPSECGNYFGDSGSPHENYESALEVRKLKSDIVSPPALVPSIRTK